MLHAMPICLTQYGMMAEKHWREHLPKLVQELEAKGQLQEALLEAALEAGADDVITTEEGFEIRCNVHAFDKISHALEKKGIKPEHTEIAYIPNNPVPVTEVHTAKTLLRLHEALEELDDVQQVFSNEEMDEAVSAAAHA